MIFDGTNAEHEGMRSCEKCEKETKHHYVYDAEENRTEEGLMFEVTCTVCGESGREL